MKLHPFERAGLGKAPFRCTHVTEKWYTYPGGRQPGSSCQYCGNGIAYEYHITGSDGKTFWVGSDCVAKTYKEYGQKEEVKGFKEVKAKFLAQKRTENRKKKWEERQAKWKAEAEERREIFNQDHPGLYETLKTLGAKSGFFKSLAESLERWGTLTPRQLEAALKAIKEFEEREAFNAGSEWVGAKGKPVSGEFEIIASRSTLIQRFPLIISYWHAMKSGGNLFTYKGSRFLGDRGDKVSGTFTVKDHTEYKGAKQTVLTRPRKLDIDEKERQINLQAV